MATTSDELKLENRLWDAANALRGNMDASDYSNVVLGLIFLKYISDSFSKEYRKLKKSEYPEDAEDKLAYTAANVFWLPKASRWGRIRKAARNPDIGQVIDKAMECIERENTSLKGILPKNYASPDLNTGRLGEVVDVVSNINMNNSESHGKDVFGRVYEYFLNHFATAERKHGGEFYTPKSVVRTLVDMIEPYKGRVYDPCCGSGGMFVQSQAFVKKHRGNVDDISIYGQESNPKTWKLCKMNLAIRGIDSDLGPHQGDTFTNDFHKGERFNYILANPPFNMKNWGADKLQHDPRWKYGMPPANNANFAWLQHIISKLSPKGKAGVVLANGALSDEHKQNITIKRNIINSDKLDAIVALPSKMFYSTGIPASLWIISNDKEVSKGKILFIDASRLGHMVDRTHRDFNSKDINKIANVYHCYENVTNEPYQDITGFCKVVTINQIKKNNYNLMPGRYVNFRQIQISDKNLNAKIKDYVSVLNSEFKMNDKLERRLRNSLKEIINER